MPKGIPKNGINKGWFEKGHIPWIKGKIGIVKFSKGTKEKMSKRMKKEWAMGKRRPGSLGKYWSEETKRKIGEKQKDEKNHNWKGDNVQYSALHKWIRKKLGKPLFCSFCGEEGKKIKRKWSIEWANINHSYKRNLSDWIALCARCHKKYDIQRKNKKNI